jgi:acetate kinase
LATAAWAREELPTSEWAAIVRSNALVLNAGSSSLKFCVYSRSELENWHLESRGQIEGVGSSPRISARDAEGGILIDQKLDASVCDGFNALETLAAWLSVMYGDGQ